MEVVDIDLDDIPLSENGPKTSSEPSVSFGGGIELLMNEKKKSASSSTKIDLEELDNLESELNDLSQTNTSAPSQSGDSKLLSGISGFGNMFGFGSLALCHCHFKAILFFLSMSSQTHSYFNQHGLR